MIKENLKALNFQPWAEIKLKGDRLGFAYKAKPADRREGFVYAWVRTDSDGKPHEVCYVGKAGGTLAARAGQHRGGFAGTGRGKALADLILPLLASGQQMMVWVRHSPTETLFGQHVSRCSVEEEALIEHLKASWNKRLPRIRKASQATAP